MGAGLGAEPVTLALAGGLDAVGHAVTRVGVLLLPGSSGGRGRDRRGSRRAGAVAAARRRADGSHHAGNGRHRRDPPHHRVRAGGRDPGADDGRRGRPLCAAVRAATCSRARTAPRRCAPCAPSRRASRSSGRGPRPGCSGSSRRPPPRLRPDRSPDSPHATGRSSSSSPVGLTNAAIAARLHLSQKTVRNYVSAVLTKLHVADRPGAIVLARECGLGRDSASG